MAQGPFHAAFIIHRMTPSRLVQSSTTGILFFFYFLFVVFVFDNSHMKHDDLSAAFSTTSLTEFK